jgi:pyruvate/2-oxoglutarate dehydrogenase complex dihydrolipoamide dehydrogenase (E3) component
MKEIVKEADGTMTVHLENGTSYGGFDCLLGATGRSPLTQTLGTYIYIYIYVHVSK